MSPKIVDKEKRKQEIARVALDLFADRGFEATSIRQIAQAAGVGKGTIYEYFDSKVEIVFAALKVWIDEMEQMAEGAAREVDHPAERLRAFALGAVESFVADERAFRLFIGMLQLGFAGSPLLSNFQIIKELTASSRAMVVEVIRDGTARGLFRPEAQARADSIAINLVAYLDGIGMHYYFDPDFVDIRRQVNDYLDGLIRSLLIEPAD